jgi:hypothetical protein
VNGVDTALRRRSGRGRVGGASDVAIGRTSRDRNRPREK